MGARVNRGLATQSFMKIASVSMAVEILTGPTSRTKRMESPMLKSSTSSRCGSTWKSINHARLLELLRFVAHRQVVRGRHSPVLNRLFDWGWIAWDRRPPRTSQLTRSHHTTLALPEDVAVLTVTGRAMLDQLAALEASTSWNGLKEIDPSNPSALVQTGEMSAEAAHASARSVLSESAED